MEDGSSSENLLEILDWSDFLWYMEDSNLVLVHRRKLDWTQEEEDQGRMTELALLPS